MHSPNELNIKSTAIIQFLTVNLPESKERSWIDTPNAKLCERNSTTTFKPWAIGLDKRDREAANDLAKKALEKETHDTFDVSVSPEFQSQGVRVLSTTQHLLYRGIQQGKKQRGNTRHTAISLARSIYTVQDMTGQTPTPEQLWRSIRHCDLPKSTRSFL